MSKRGLWANALGFQVVWWTLALCVPLKWYLPCVLIPLVFILWQWRSSVQPARDARLVLACLILGWVLDTSLMQLGLLSFVANNPAWLARVQPWWMLLLWVSLGLTLNASLRWLRDWPKTAWVVFPLGLWASYWAAHSLQVLALSQQGLSHGALGLAGVALVWVEKRWVQPACPTHQPTDASV